MKLARNGISVLMTAEGTYPYALGGVSTWCDSLLKGTPEISYMLLPLMMNPHVDFKFALPANVKKIINVPLWGIEEPAEFITEIPFGRHYLQKLRTSPEIIRGKFIPLFRSFLDLVNDEGADPEGFGKTLFEMAGYFQTSDYNTTFKSPLVWDIFRSSMEAYSARLQGAATVWHSDEAPSLFDLTESLRWLYRFLIVLNAPVPKTTVTHSTAAAFCGIPSIIAKLRYGTPMLLTEHGVYLREQNLFLSRFRRLIFAKRFLLNLITAVSRANYWFADIVSPVCHYNTRWELAHGTAPEKIRVVYNGVDPEQFSPGPRPAGPPHVVATARIDPLKDIETFLHMAALILKTKPEVRFTIFGSIADPVYYEKCLALRSELGLDEVVRMGTPTSDVVGAYRSGDLVALTSVSEAFPYSVIEAMSCSRTVVASDVGGVREAVADCGVIVKPRDVEGFASAVLALLADPKRREMTGEAARQRVLESFTLQKSIAGYRSLYQELAA